MYRFFLVLCICTSFFFASTHIHAQSTPQTIDALIEAGRFTPQQFFSLKPPLRLPAISEDGSILQYVDPNHPLEDRRYRPKDLVSLSGAGINQAGRQSLYRDIITEDLKALAQAFREEF